MTTVNGSSQVGSVYQSVPTTGPATALPSTEVPALLPSPEFVSGDPVAMLAKLLVTNAQKQRENDSTSAGAMDRAEDAADARRIDALEDKAKYNFMAGMVSGVGQLAQAATSFGSASAQAHAQAATPSVSAQAEQSASGRLAKLGAEGVGRIADIETKRWTGAGEGAAGFGKVGEAAFKKYADEADIDATRADNESKTAKRASEALRKQEDAAAQDTQKIIGILQDIKNAQAQEEHAALFKM